MHDLRAGLIGLGMMGRPMASRLHAAGHDLIVHDATASATRAFTDAHAGVVEADGLPAFAACSAVVLMLPDSDAVEAVVLGRDGARGLDPPRAADPLRPATLPTLTETRRPPRGVLWTAPC